MKKSILSLVFLLTVAVHNLAFAADDTPVSGVKAFTLNAKTEKNLFVLNKVWGLLKYFHPAVADGKYKWDDELFKEMNKVELDNRAFDEELLRWITSLDKPKACNSCKPATTDSLLQINRWIQNETYFSPALGAALKTIIINRNNGSNKYVALYPGVHNPDFKGDNDYFGATYDDLGCRLLCLFRFWNMVEYFAPDKYLIGEDWNAVLKRQIPVFANAKTSLDYKLAVWGMINSIHDTHGNLYSHMNDPELLNFMGGNRQVAAKLGFIDNKWVVYRADADTTRGGGLKPGDIIVRLNGTPVTERANRLTPYACASNQATAYRNIGRDLLWSNDALAKLDIIRDGKEVSLSVPTISTVAYMNFIPKSTMRPAGEPLYRLLDPQVGYVSFDRIKSSFFKQMFEDFKDTKGIVLDIRNYPSEFVVFSLNEYLREKPAPFAKFTSTDPDYPGMFTFSKNIIIGKKNKDNYKGKIVVLVNEDSQSQAEYTAMSLRADDRAIVMGSQTAGADGNISLIMLPGKLSTLFSGLGVFYPDGKETQRIGIVPDVVVKPTIKGLAAGRDEVLEKAVEWVKRN